MKENGLKFLTARERRALQEYLGRLRADFGAAIERVILYGSKVRGDFDAESDIDLCVVVRDLDSRKRRGITEIGVEVDLKHNVLFGDFILDRKQFALMRKYREPLYQDLQSEGIELWTKQRKRSSPKKWNARTTTSVSRKRSTHRAAIAKQSAAPIMPSLPQPARRSSRKVSPAKNIRA